MAKETKGKKQVRERKVSESKLKAVDDISKLIKTSNAIMIASIKSIPSSQFQDIRKKLRNDAIIFIAKKSTIDKALDKGNDSIKSLKNHVKSDYALLFSKLNSFELASLLSENRSPVKAKIGQEAVEDIVVDAGPTELVPGPAISELGSLGLKIAIEDGKINIKESRAIVKKGEKISEAAASIMTKLNIKPFAVGFEPIAAYDTNLNKVYVGIRVNKTQTLEELKLDYARSLGFAQKIEYICKGTIGFLLAKAQSHERALEKITPSQDTEKKEENITENISEAVPQSS